MDSIKVIGLSAQLNHYVANKDCISVRVKTHKVVVAEALLDLLDIDRRGMPGRPNITFYRFCEILHDNPNWKSGFVSWRCAELVKKAFKLNPQEIRKIHKHIAFVTKKLDLINKPPMSFIDLAVADILDFFCVKLGGTKLVLSDRSTVLIWATLDYSISDKIHSLPSYGKYSEVKRILIDAFSLYVQNARRSGDLTLWSVYSLTATTIRGCVFRL
jgi:hypothetical protein